MNIEKMITGRRSQESPFQVVEIFCAKDLSRETRIRVKEQRGSSKREFQGREGRII